jgi:alkanesulfonate monooxygenase SsuD/methylene tetrahydromethanopterin reductase-like flavin-dependent oxidoreductase (luciferase family)
MAQEAEDAGFDMVMVSDHVLLGPSAGSEGRMANPRDYAMPGALKDVEIVASKLGDQAGITGAAVLARQRMKS